MQWYAAHTIMYVKFSDGNQDTYPLWENIILIEASSDEEALEKAQTRAKEDEIYSEDNFTWQQRSAALIFAGVRKLILCQNPEEQPRNGTEISYSQMEVKTQENLFKLVRGEPIEVLYEE